MFTRLCCVLQTTVLHRDQTDEWKGWMQLVILVYHITGASKVPFRHHSMLLSLVQTPLYSSLCEFVALFQVLPIYMQIRVLVSSYLFLSGFGHFHYFFNKADFSFHRLLAVNSIMNLSIVTGNSYI